MESCDKLPPPPSGSATLVDDTSSCNASLTFNRGGSGFAGWPSSATPSSRDSGVAARFRLVVVVVRDVFVDCDLVSPRERESLAPRRGGGGPAAEDDDGSKSSSMENGSKGLSDRDMVRQRCCGRK